MDNSPKPSVPGFMLRSVVTSKQGWLGIALILGRVLWQGLDIWQAADFLPHRLMPLADVLDGFWGTIVIVLVGLAFIYRSVHARWPSPHAEVTRGAVSDAPSPLSQPDTETLKERYLSLSGELIRFADERDETDPVKKPDETLGTWGRSKKQTAHDDETKALYSLQFGGRVAGALDGAEERKWITTEERRSLEGNIAATFRWHGPTTYIRQMAQQLERFGHRL